MNRPLKFRAWDLVGNRMLYDGMSIYEDSPASFPEDGFIYMQFTGLLDKNGVEIYESDILRSHYSYKEVGVVDWIEGGFWIHHEDAPNSMPAEMNREIIGNIHEHRHLLEEA